MLPRPTAPGALPGSVKIADPALTPPPAAPGPRLAEGGKSMQKAMRLGAPQPSSPAPQASGSGGEWKRKVLSGGM